MLSDNNGIKQDSAAKNSWEIPKYLNIKEHTSKSTGIKEKTSNNF